MQLINLTTTDVCITMDRGIITIFPSGTVARCVETREPFTILNNGLPLQINRIEKRVVGLPEPEEGIWYIVDPEVANISKRKDLLILDEEFDKHCTAKYGHALAMVKVVY
jgi:hypothetical protein